MKVCPRNENFLHVASKPVYTTTTYTQQPAARQVAGAKPVSTGYVYGTTAIAAATPAIVSTYTNTSAPTYNAAARKPNQSSGDVYVQIINREVDFE